jgi:hypothetical protein
MLQKRNPGAGKRMREWRYAGILNSVASPRNTLCCSGLGSARKALTDAASGCILGFGRRAAGRHVAVADAVPGRDACRGQLVESSETTSRLRGDWPQPNASGPEAAGPQGRCGTEKRTGSGAPAGAHRTQRNLILASRGSPRYSGLVRDTGGFLHQGVGIPASGRRCCGNAGQAEVYRVPIQRSHASTTAPMSPGRPGRPARGLGSAASCMRRRPSSLTAAGPPSS